jgi:single-strand DNA-binding protein
MMTTSLNRVELIGRLGADPTVTHLAQGVVCTFNVATNYRWRDSAGQQHEETEWTRVEVWGRQAENCGRYLVKGSLVRVEGRLRTRSWEEQESGQTRYATNVRAADVLFLDRRGQDSDTSDRPFEIEDLPF